MISLTPRQTEAIRWLVQEVRAGRLDEDFHPIWAANGALRIMTYRGDKESIPRISRGSLDALTHANLLLRRTIRHSRGSPGSMMYSEADDYTVLNNAYAFVDGLAQTTPDESLKVRLRRLLKDRIDTDDLKEFCQDLGVEYQNLPADTLRGQTRELLDWAERRNKMNELIQIIRLNRPDLAGDLPE
jgi:hypothetical protein